MKYLALLSAVALVGGYVYLKSGTGKAIPLSRISPNIAKDVKLMPGSKSSAPFTTSDRLDAKPPQVMSGSKSMSPLIDGENVLFGDGTTTQPATQPTTNPAK